ncbi:MAG: phytoene desaturase family protein [Gemmatimonadota bacterium]
MAGFDCLIIGGGHNGLVAAAYVARAGRRVCVLERRHVLGGCCSTEELWPGFRVSPAAYVISLLLPRIIRELQLRENGLEILPRDPSSFTPLPGGGCLLLGADAVSNQREIAKFSARDADAYGRYVAFLDRVAGAIEAQFVDPLPELPPRVRDLPRWRRLYRAVKGLGADLHSAMALLSGAATSILDRWFESEVLKATFATDAVIGAFLPPSAPGSAYVLLHHVMGEAGGGRGAWGYVRGGMGGLADALAGTCGRLGVEIRREAEVTAIDVADGRVRGVSLAGGAYLSAAVVASSLDAHQTFARLVGLDRLPEDYAARISAIDYASASLKINLALDGLPSFDTGDIDPAIALRGTIHIAPALEYIERAFDDAKYGFPSREPVLEITIPTVVDDTLAPPGKHIASMFVQYAPYRLANGSWDEKRKEEFADRCLDIVARYAPDFRELVLHRQVLAPPDLERVYGLTGGNIMQGAMNLDQMGPLRVGYRTPIRGLYLCGAATHPGGGVMGACGLNAAREILRGCGPAILRA